MEDSDSELKLSEPLEIPAERYLSQSISDLLRDVPDSASQSPDDDQIVPPSAAPKDRMPDNEFSIKCPVCDTLLYATEDEIGQHKTCLDCYSEVEITRPRPKPRRVNDVVDADYEGQVFALSEPVSRDIYDATTSSYDPKSFGQQALRNAERELDRQNEETFELPSSPLWTGLFRFLADASVVVRWLVSAALLGSMAKLTLATIAWMSAGGPELFWALVGAMGLVVLTVLSVVVIGTTCLTILQDTANGQDAITQWPESGFLDLIGESLVFALAVFYSILPGLIPFVIAGAFGVLLEARWVFLGLSLYVFFPVVQMSLLETASLSTPFSQPILASIRAEFLLWCTFYLSSFAIALFVALTALAGLQPTLSTLVLMLLAGVWVLALFLYFRLLGRLAWACQVRPLMKSNESDEDQDL
ncbi:MAG: hypothetical protein ACYC3X_12490 [Pirellulaceae bacterium]